MFRWLKFTLRDWVWLCIVLALLFAFAADELTKGANVFYWLIGGEPVPGTLNGDLPPSSFHPKDSR